MPCGAARLERFNLLARERIQGTDGLPTAQINGSFNLKGLVGGIAWIARVRLLNKHQ